MRRARKRTRNRRRLILLLSLMLTVSLGGIAIVMHSNSDKKQAVAEKPEAKPEVKPTETPVEIPAKEPEAEAQPPVSITPVSQQIERKVFYNGSAADGKQVALTFDDGPDAVATPKILDILKENHIKATFFIVGSQAKAHPDMVKRIVQEGHTIGNHSWSHPNFNKLSIGEATKQINDTQDQLEAITGFRPNLFRPPYGNLDKAEEEMVHDMNLAIVDWSVDTLDWAGSSTPNIIKTVHKQLRPGGIILQHCAGGKNHLSNTVGALKQLIPDLKAQGYTFVTVPELLKLPDAESH